MSLGVLVRRELKSVLKNPQVLAGILLPPLLFIALGGVVGAGIREAAEAIELARVAVVDLDGTWLTRGITAHLNASMGGRVHLEEGGEGERLLSAYDVVIVIQKGFTEMTMTGLSPLPVEAYVRIDELSMAAGGRLELANSLANIMTDALRRELVTAGGLGEEVLKVRVLPLTSVSLGGLRLSASEAQAVLTTIASSGLIVTMLVALVFQFGALSMAQEKEEKTFETLLSQPVTRAQVGVAKVLGVLAVSTIEATAFIFSWTYYMRSLAAGETGVGLFRMVLEKAGVPGLTLSFASLFIVMLAGSVLGLVVGGLSRDTRSAGIVSGPLWIVVVALSFVTLQTGVPYDTPGLLKIASTLVLSPIASFVALLLGNIKGAVAMVLVNSAQAFLLLYVLKRLLESEVVVLGVGRPKLRA